MYLSRSHDGSTFSEPVRVNDVAGDAAPHEQAPAQVAVAPDGAIHVVWQNNTHVEGRRFPYSDLRYARSSDDGRTFGRAITVNDDAGGLPASHTFHDLAIGSDGTIYISWIDGRASAAAAARLETVATRSTHAAPGRSTPISTATNVDTVRRGGHTMDDSGLPGPEIRLARSIDGGRSFEASVVIATEACPCCRTSIAAGAHGAVYVAWRDVTAEDVRDIVVAGSSDGGVSFAPPAFVHRDGWRIAGCPHVGPALALGAEDRLHVAWYTGAEGRAGVYHGLVRAQGRDAAVPAEDRDGAGWAYAHGEAYEAYGGAQGYPSPIMIGEWVPVSQVRAAADGEDLWLAWEDRRGDEPLIEVGRARGTRGARAAAAFVVAGTAPALAANGDTRALSWLHDGAVKFRLIRSPE